MGSTLPWSEREGGGDERKVSKSMPTKGTVFNTFSGPEGAETSKKEKTSYILQIGSLQKRKGLPLKISKRTQLRSFTKNRRSYYSSREVNCQPVEDVNRPYRGGFLISSKLDVGMEKKKKGAHVKISCMLGSRCQQSINTQKGRH